jgi:hypothetical protein
MATFPTLTPSSRTFTPGRHPHSGISTLNGLQTRVMTSNAILDQQLRLTFIGLTEAEMLSIRSHYIGQQGRFLSFAIPSSLLSGMTTPASFTPTAASWIYGGAPQVEDIPCAQRYNVSIELVTVPGEGANINGDEFTVSITLAAGAASVPVNVTGFDLTVTASIEGGVVADNSSAGFDLTVTVAFVADISATASGFDLTVTASLAAGAATGEKPSHTFSSAGSTASFAERLGYRFTVGSSDITCQSLGVYMPGSSIVERVTIHRVDTGASITTADITSTANGWVDASVTPVVLSAGVQYVISSRRTTGASRSVYRNPSGLTFDSAIGTTSYWFGTSDSQPTSSTANAYVFARFLFT